MPARAFLEVCIAIKLLLGSWTGLVVSSAFSAQAIVSLFSSFLMESSVVCQSIGKANSSYET